MLNIDSIIIIKRKHRQKIKNDNNRKGIIIYSQLKSKPKMKLSDGKSLSIMISHELDKAALSQNHITQWIVTV